MNIHYVNMLNKHEAMKYLFKELNIVDKSRDELTTDQFGSKVGEIVKYYNERFGYY